MRRHVILAAVLALALGSVVATVPAAAAGPSSDQEIADAAVLSIDDVPEGFDEKDPKDEPAPDIASCKAISKAADALNDSPNDEVDYGAGSGDAQSRINNQVSVLPTVKRARAVSRAYFAPKAGDCLAETFEQRLEEDTGGDATVDVDSFEPDAGDAAVGYEGSIDVSAGGDEASFFIDVEVIVVDRAVAAFFFLNSGGPPPSDDVSEMIDTVVERLEGSLA